MNLLASSTLSKEQKIIFGSIILITIDVIWVLLSLLTKYLCNYEPIKKPFCSTYVRTSLMTVYLLGFIIWPPWKHNHCSKPPNYVYLDSEQDEEDVDFEDIHTKLSAPVYVPVKTPSRENCLDKNSNSGTESDDSSVRSVRFSKVAEVRQLSNAEANDALLARLSYQASLRANKIAKFQSLKLPVYQILKLAFFFSLLWFAADYTYQMALLNTDIGVLNILSATTTLYTLLLSAKYPSGVVDSFSISKLLAVIFSILGVIIIYIPNISLEAQMSKGILFSVLSGLLHAAYFVFLRRAVECEEKIDIPVFFGFVGLFCYLLLWPLFFVLHFTKIETFEAPKWDQPLPLLLNGFFGTVIAEALRLWGCLLTSSLIASVAINLCVPMLMLIDILLDNATSSLLFYMGMTIIIASFLAVIAFTYFENWDPLLSILHSFYMKLCYKVRISSRLEDLTSEQRESLMEIDSDGE